MVSTVWNYGIDWDTDETGETALANWFFIDPINGSDDNDGSPLNPWRTLEHAYSNTSDQDSFVLAKGFYSVGGTNAFGRHLYGNQRTGTILYSTGGNVTNITNEKSYNNLTLHDFNFSNLRNIDFAGCILSKINTSDLTDGLSGFTRFVSCEIIESNIYAVSVGAKRFHHSSVYNSVVKLSIKTITVGVQLRVTFSFIDANSTLIIDSINSASAIIGSNIVGSLVMVNDTVPTPTGTSIQPTPLGDNDKLQFVVSEINEVIGINSGYTAGLSQGLILDKGTEGYGFNADLNQGVEFSDGGYIENDNVFPKTIETKRISFGQVRRGFKIDVNGLVINLVDVFDDLFINPNNNILFENPKPTNYEMQWSRKKGGAFNGVWKAFQYDLPASLDQAGRSTAQVGFNPSQEPAFIEAHDIKLRFIYR